MDKTDFSKGYNVSRKRHGSVMVQGKTVAQPETRMISTKSVVDNFCPKSRSRWGVTQIDYVAHFAPPQWTPQLGKERMPSPWLMQHFVGLPVAG